MQLKSNIKCLLVMRVLKKKLIFSNGQQEHVLREGRILMETRCPFIVRCLFFIIDLMRMFELHKMLMIKISIFLTHRLHKTFRDTECLYILTEACLGGDLRHVLTDK